MPTSQSNLDATRHGTLALDMESSTLDKKIDSREYEEEHEELLIWLQVE